MNQIKADPTKPDELAKYQWVEHADNRRKKRQASDDQIMMFNCDVAVMYDIQRKSINFLLAYEYVKILVWPIGMKSIKY